MEKKEGKMGSARVLQEIGKIGSNGSLDTEYYGANVSKHNQRMARLCVREGAESGEDYRTAKAGVKSAGKSAGADTNAGVTSGSHPGGVLGDAANAPFVGGNIDRYNQRMRNRCVHATDTEYVGGNLDRYNQRMRNRCVHNGKDKREMHTIPTAYVGGNMSRYNERMSRRQPISQN
uniref:Uncharacterized protein n=1 Tax=Erythrolobus australicus TaxID=1077150 RepID=A0A7S1TKN0_9RHOD|eukprot:CAMPEP_0185842256 /NCGR_PEP_ID=MMETSP1353-20130828/18257_1 /TAXON_ID=1077150 /ORGANISM="Erythrolobus australicus, Strain CCMP3124" /LENGTH=175 /DNA_ID=CAMNT_0028541753 /DNA_START=1412 /DNA_END=1939 /DNA_ORIENTATION=+